MHFLDLFWGAQKHHKIVPNSSRFCWNVTRCVSMFYSKSVKTELQDSVKCAKILKCQEKMSFQWGTNQTETLILVRITCLSKGCTIHFLEKTLFISGPPFLKPFFLGIIFYCSYDGITGHFLDPKWWIVLSCTCLFKNTHVQNIHTSL